MTGQPTLVPHDARLETRSDGTMIMTSGYPLADPAARAGDWLHDWAAKASDRVFLAERSGDGWREISYGEALDMVRALAAAMLGLGLKPGDRMAILSGNSVNHGLICLAAQYIGVAAIPVAEQYSLIPGAHDRLIYILNKTKPALIYVEDAGQYGEALKLDALSALPVVATRTAAAPRPVIALDDLLKTNPTADADTAFAATGPETLAKILFTSGSTSNPKGVPTTQHMMCVNQSQLLGTLPFLADRPPKIVDWLPWNHVFGGSHNFNMMLANGGSLYIDDGKPTKDLFPKTLRNLQDHVGTIAFNVPVGWGLLASALDKDADLSRRFYGDLDMIFYAGASLPAEVWSKLENQAMAETGHIPLMTSSWGMTETAPATLIVHEPIGQTGVIGVPVAGVEVKLIPNADMRCEMRVKGPNNMTGYYEDPEKSAEAFDEDGFLITGDAVKFRDPGNPNGGLIFDGRMSEDFKLTTGTWVQTAKLRAQALTALGGIAQDVVITGHDRGEVGMLVFPSPDGMAAAGLSPTAGDGVLTGADLAAYVAPRMAELAASSTGSSTRIGRALFLAEPPSLQDHEMTAKGNLNLRQVLTRRAALVDRLYQDTDPTVIKA
jgi:feruloyl-CoA synthase